MGTHPIFESDFDCLTESEKFSGDRIYYLQPSKGLTFANGRPQEAHQIKAAAAE